MMDAGELIRAAAGVVDRAYAPYSHFHVGAALLTKDGRIYTGVNIENASYPAGICAERNAFGTAVAAGERVFEAIAIVGGKDGILSGYCPPCGICRQVMREFADPETFRIILARSETDFREYRLCELLPESFGPEML